MDISLIISIVSIVFVIVSFVVSRKDKSNSDVEKDSYKQGVLDQKLKNIMDKLDKIETKLDNMENETKKIVQEEMDKHIAIYHSK